MSYESDNVQELNGVEVLKNEGQAALLAKAEIDMQIATAQAYPRSLTFALRRMTSLATMTPEIAEKCEYALPRGKNKDGTPNILHGPSVRLAEIVFSQYGNCRGGARVIMNDGKKVIAQGIFHDLETNACVTIEVSRSIQQHIWEDDPTRPGKKRKSGRMETMSEDMQIVTGNAACGIAFRNAVFKGIPGALIEPVIIAAKKVALGDAETLPTRRENCLKYLHELGVEDKQICEALGIKDVLDIDLEGVFTLRGMLTTIKEGGSTVEQMFPKAEKKGAAAAGAAATNATAQAIKDQQNRVNRKSAAEKKDGEDGGENSGKVNPK